MKIKVIKELDLDKFTDSVNKHLTNGWELFGDPKIETVVLNRTWDGDPYSQSHTIYHQILKTKLEYMKTDSQKLKEILKLIKQYHKDINEACDKDCEVTLGGNGINSNEAYLTFSAFEDDVATILKD